MPDVWAIDGVEVPAAVARAVAYASSGGAEGVVEPEGLKVAELDVPSTQVRVLPGAALVRNRYAGGSLQTYAVLEQVQQSLPVVATGSSGGRSDLVIVRVTDPEFGSGDEGASFAIVQGVPDTAGAEYAATLGYPALALARIDIPASTATITEDMITDLRKVANPKVERFIVNATMPGGVDLTSSSFVDWPDDGVVVQVPEWATTATIRADIQVGMYGPNAEGVLRLAAGATVVHDQRWNIDTEAGGAQRITMQVGGTVALVDSPGGPLRLKLRGRRTSGTGRLSSRPDSTYMFDIEFRQEAV